MKKILAIFLSVSAINLYAQLPPDIIYGELFKEVQLQKILPDGKTFVDCVPKNAVRDIMYNYGISKPTGDALKKFVEQNFVIPVSKNNDASITPTKNVVTHINQLWDVLLRTPDEAVHGSSLLPLPKPYIVPGGRFREIYYWDSYFTMLGLKESGKTNVIENMVDNFAFLIKTYGHIPNGNRSYYLSRSQPPFFSMMVELLASIKGNTIYKKYLPALQKEYDYWMEGADKLKPGEAFKRVVQLKDGTILNRYWDEAATPRQESYKEDVETAEQITTNKTMTMRFASNEARENFIQQSNEEAYHHLRAGAASGWDFSSRWFADEKNITTIQTTDIIPVDLNCLILNLEKVLKLAGGKVNLVSTINRQSSIINLFWNKSVSFFTDYNFKTETQQNNITAVGMFPFNFLLAQNVKPAASSYIAKATTTLKNNLLKDGGIVTTTNTTGQQWDAPNGWAPLQWMTIKGLENFGQKNLAKDIAQSWIKLNNNVFLRTGKLMEKYNVVNANLDAGGGEYPGQDGFGWTNGVLLALIKKYGLPK